MAATEREAKEEDSWSLKLSIILIKLQGGNDGLNTVIPLDQLSSKIKTISLNKKLFK